MTLWFGKLVYPITRHDVNLRTASSPWTPSVDQVHGSGASEYGPGPWTLFTIAVVSYVADMSSDVM